MNLRQQALRLIVCVAFGALLDTRSTASAETLDQQVGAASAVCEVMRLDALPGQQLCWIATAQRLISKSCFPDMRCSIGKRLVEATSRSPRLHLELLDANTSSPNPGVVLCKRIGLSARAVALAKPVGQVIWVCVDEAKNEAADLGSLLGAIGFGTKAKAP